ncbi:7TM diverse intracellular signaling domain-containing protein [Cytophagaceae bacterium YF14B1]|uniref:histidine kinase n=1 Tax=Xanthocytophaga flava TaxID=3048013 RepID=A0AAE3QZX7_9BACT|nr:7TM diverse intracellular signaling domain-containing protein [Xanthocytophaga flavus]MDJ1485799.1 7TM diverse intracellular signaling domain-containing protein [Xanthocytophaga flavus]
MAKQSILLYLISLHICCVAFAQKIITIGDNDRVPVGTSSYFYIDSTNSLSFDTVKILYTSHSFTESKSQIPNFGNTKSVVWMAFTVAHTMHVPYLLEINNTQLQNVILYYPDANGEYKVKEGLAGKDFQINKWLFELPALAGPITCFIRFQSNRVVTLPGYITTYRTLLNRNHRFDFVYGIYFGLMLIMVMYNCFLYFIFRESSYIWYIFHITFQILINLLLKGFVFEFFPEYAYRINVYLPGIAMCSYFFMILFTKSFLDTPKRLPELHKGLYILSILIFCGILVNLLPIYLWDSYIGIVISLITSVYLLLIAGVALAKNMNGSVFYCLGWGVFLLSLLLLNLSLLGWIPGSIYTENATLWGGAIECMFISLALSDKINQLQKEKENSQAEKLHYMTQQNTLLEEKVIERTQRLVSANTTMEAQYHVLHQQKEELKAVNETLVEQKQLIETQTHTLIELNRELENTVQERTFELKNTIESLIQQNQDLHQFSYILSHNLRSPIARIKGLTTIFNKEDMNDPFNLELLGYLQQCADNLDLIIHDLSHIITIRKNLNTIKEEINLYDLFDTVTKGLTTEIEQANAKIIADFSSKEVVYSVKSYLHSILYNLISNAIKYRSPDRIPSIHVKVLTDNTYTCLIVKDNGLGIDLNIVTEQQIFGFYKRVHSHVDGKGLGLYLVKTQVETLQGKVEVESMPDQGSTFKVYF